MLNRYETNGNIKFGFISYLIDSLVIKNKLDLVITLTELVDNDRKLVLILNLIASKGTHEQTLQFYDKFIKNCDIKEALDPRIPIIMMEHLFKIGTEDAFEKQKEIRNKFKSMSKTWRSDSIHFLTAFKLNKYDYCINEIKNTSNEYKYRNILMIAQLRSNLIGDALSNLSSFIDNYSNSSIPTIFDETVSEIVNIQA
jgi:hypothetical protein